MATVRKLENYNARSDIRGAVTAETAVQNKASLATKTILVTENVRTDQEAIAQKMKLLQSKILGIFSPVTYTLVSERKVLIPFEELVFSYHIDRGAGGLNKHGYFNREGEIAVIYDMNEEHAFHFDLYDKLPLLKRQTETLRATILPDKCSADEVAKRCKEIVTWKMLHRVYRSTGMVTLERRQRFYREAWELTTECRGKTFLRYAYMDNYASQNEHVSGLRVRLDV